jgi:hypothetical protein
MGLHIESLSYPEAMLNQWRRGNRRLTRELPKASFLRRILCEKIRNRGKLDRRFFGETFVATRVAHEDGWYGSFKWLSSWPATDGSRYATEYRAALKKHFPAVSEISLSGMPLREHLEGKKPMPPDLWLFVNGAHQFIEVKLPGDSIRPSQIAGLAQIATCLSGTRPVSVWIYNLYPERHRPTPVPTTVQVHYEKFCYICRQPNPTMEPSAPSLSRARRGSSRDR